MYTLHMCQINEPPATKIPRFVVFVRSSCNIHVCHPVSLFALFFDPYKLLRELDHRCELLSCVSSYSSPQSPKKSTSQQTNKPKGTHLMTHPFRLRNTPMPVAPASFHTHSLVPLDSSVFSRTRRVATIIPTACFPPASAVIIMKTLTPSHHLPPAICPTL